MMKIKKVLVLYKRSVYANYFLNKRSSLRKRRAQIPKENIQRLKIAHAKHYKTLEIVERCLKAYHLRYEKSTRGRKVNYARYDLVITIGGDGTFLEGARGIREQLILGVNSAPKWSVGRFCIANADNFSLVLKKVIQGKFRVRTLHRLHIKGIPALKNVNILNDILVAHANPAAMSRYSLSINGKKEGQRSSGLWIATAAGSTGGIYAAGGKVLPIESMKFQYFCRELWRGKQRRYAFRKGILNPEQKIKITSLMREGAVFIDGSRLRQSFPFGQTIVIGISPVHLKAIVV